MDAAALVEDYRRIGVVAIARREGVSRHEVNRLLRAAGVKLDGIRRGNLLTARPCPDDFPVRYAEQGVDGCVDLYRVNKRTIVRWRAACGEAELRRLRKAYLDENATPAARKIAINARPAPMSDGLTERAAAHYLRFPRSGGWVVTRSSGLYIVGTMPMSPAQMIDFAVARGFRRSA